MHAVSRQHPLEIAAMPPPPPPLIPKPKHNDPPRAYPASNYAPFKSGQSVLHFNAFVQALRLYHRRTLMLPALDPPSDLKLSAYMRDILMQSSADLLSRLYSKDIRAVTLDLHDPDECICAVTFCAYDDQGAPVRTRFMPVLLYVPNDLPHLDVPSPCLSFALKQIHDVDEQSPVIATDFQEIVAFSCLLSDNTRQYERINSTKDILLALRTVTAAYLYNSLEMSGYIPYIGALELDDGELPLKGPPLDPKTPMLADDEVFTTFKRLSDFDLVSLQWDKQRALQFFRWKEHVCTTENKLIAHPGDILLTQSNRITHALPKLNPLIPLDVSMVPPETFAHATTIQRPCPLRSAVLRSLFFSSISFTLEILEVISKGKVMNSPVLCLKLFDDRFQRMHFFEEEEKDPLKLPYGWTSRLVPADWQAREEHAAYTKINSFQGSFFPWYYGAHMFTLSNGLQVYGVLLEYIPGWSLGSEEVRNLSTELQIHAIQSCRHAVRVLDIADIAQHDWHAGQLLVHRAQNGDMHVVLIDLAACTQTVNPDDFNELRNFAGAFHTLAGTFGDSGLDLQLVVDHFGRPDPWDPVTVGINVPVGPPEANQYKPYIFAAPDPFGLKFEIPSLS